MRISARHWALFGKGRASSQSTSSQKPGMARAEDAILLHWHKFVLAVDHAQKLAALLNRVDPPVFEHAGRFVQPCFSM